MEIFLIVALCFGCIYMVFQFFLFFLMALNPCLQSHPGTFIMLMELCGISIMYCGWIITANEYDDYFVALEKVIYYSLFERFYIIILAIGFYYTSFFMAMLYDIILSIDVYISIRDPFYPSGRRKRNGHLIVIILGILYYVVQGILAKFEYHSSLDFQLFTLGKITKKIQFVVLFSLLATTTLTSSLFALIYSYRILFKKYNLTKKQKRYFIQRRVLYFWGWIISSIPALLDLVLPKVAEFNTQSFFFKFNIVFAFVFAVMFPIFTCMEKHIWSFAIYKLTSLFCSKNKDRIKKLIYFKGKFKRNENIFLFINSSLNVEMVQIIIQSISLAEKEKYQYLAHHMNYGQKDILSFSKIQIEEFPSRNQSFQSNIMIQQNSSFQKSFIEIDAKLIAYDMTAFSAIRELDNLTPEVLFNSLDLEKNSKAIFQAGESKGKSGSFFFFTYDKRLLIKTVPKSELNNIIKCLPEFHCHFEKNPNSLIARIYGAFTLKMKKFVPVHFILMQNTISAEKNKILSIYDLKGSLISRFTKIKKNKKSSILKDQNFIHDKKLKKISCDFLLEDQNNIESIFEKDVQLLLSNNFMDYSLLLALTNRSEDVSSDEMERNVFFVRNKKYMVYFGIIDYLQKYNFEKKIERFFKAIKYLSRKNQISSVNSEFYAKRFLRFINQVVFPKCIK